MDWPYKSIEMSLFIGAFLKTMLKVLQLEDNLRKVQQQRDYNSLIIQSHMIRKEIIDSKELSETKVLMRFFAQVMMKQGYISAALLISSFTEKSDIKDVCDILSSAGPISEFDNISLSFSIGANELTVKYNDGQNMLIIPGRDFMNNVRKDSYLYMLLQRTPYTCSRF